MGKETTMEERPIEDEFGAVMRQLALDCEVATGRRPHGLYTLMNKHGGVGAAHHLLNRRRLSRNFRRLAKIGRLDLAVEALALNPRWGDLFSEQQKTIARRRLDDNGGENVAVYG